MVKIIDLINSIIMYPCIRTLQGQDNIVKSVAIGFNLHAPAKEGQIDSMATSTTRRVQRAHVIAQNGKDRLDLYHVDNLSSQDTLQSADIVDKDEKITLRFIKSQRVFGGIYLFEKIEVDSGAFLLLMTSDMILYLLKVET